VIIYAEWNKPWQVKPFKWWIFHRWCDYWEWHKGMPWDGLRILGFTYHNYEVTK